ncbi:hypothetical protein [Flavitalea sp.]|nr:hypothetical protein [Flavitalea sp.]
MNRLDYLKRKQKGKFEILKFKKLLGSLFLEDFECLDLVASDEILSYLKTAFLGFKIKNEIVNGQKTTFVDSDLLREIYLTIQEDSTSYIFNENFENCGLFLVGAKSALEQAFNIAKEDEGNTCFILDQKFSYYFRINYNDRDHIENPNSYDIQLTYKK